MRSFDASSTAADVVPVNVLARLDDLIGDYLLVGARARDLITYCIAGLPLGRATLDVDISVAVRDHAELSELMSTLRTGRRKGVRFSVGKMPVDLLPYGNIASRGIVEPDEGVFLDVTGMCEARATALAITVAKNQCVNCASLAAILLLKLVAWDVRRSYSGKDAQDLAILLDASHSGLYEEHCWGDDGALYDYDPFLVGPYLQGRAIAGDFTEASASRILPLLSDRQQRERLVARMPPALAPRSEQLKALAAGIASR